MPKSTASAAGAAMPAEGHKSRRALLRLLGAAPALAIMPAAALAGGWRSWRAGQHRFGLYSAGTAVTMLATMALAGAGFGQSPRLVNLGGLFQRAERRLAVVNEDIADRLADRLLDDAVGVKEADAEQPGEQRAHG